MIHRNNSNLGYNVLRKSNYSNGSAFLSNLKSKSSFTSILNQNQKDINQNQPVIKKSSSSSFIEKQNTLNNIKKTYSSSYLNDYNNKKVDMNKNHKSLL